MPMRKLYMILTLAFLQLLSMNAFAEGRKTFFSSSLDMPCGYEKLAKLLAMDVDELVLDGLLGRHLHQRHHRKHL